MDWPEAFAILFGVLGFAAVLNGFPDIKIGGTHNYVDHNYFNDKKEEDEDA
jgi:hypothetical protein